MPGLLPIRRQQQQQQQQGQDKKKDNNSAKKKKQKQQPFRADTASAAVEAITNNNIHDFSSNTSGTGMLTTTASGTGRYTYTPSEATTSFSEGQFAFSSTSRNLNIQFANKVKESRKQIGSLAIRNKLDQQGVNLNKLHTSSDFVGRDKEVQLLRSVFERTVVSKNNKNNNNTSATIIKRSAIVSISGLSGTGKTVLAKQLKELTRQKGGFFCLGKFDLKKSTKNHLLLLKHQQHQDHPQQQHAKGSAQPYRAFMAASHDLAEQILECEAKILLKQQKQQQQQKKAEESSESLQPQQQQEHNTATTTTTTDTATTTESSSNDDNSNNNKKQQQQQHPLGEKIEQAVGKLGVRLLLEIFPGLTKVLRMPVEETTSREQQQLLQTGIEQKTSQLTFVVTQLFRVLARYGSQYFDSNEEEEESSSSDNSSQFFPIVLVLDDVQWADQQSLNLAQAIWNDPETSFMLIATSRSDEMTDDHPFEVKLKETEGRSYNDDDDSPSKNKNKKPIRVERIITENLTEDAVRTIIANYLRDTEDYVKGLADVVFEKTLGNAYFVNEFLQTLVNDGLLTYNLGMLKWHWEEEKIQTLSVADNVGSLLSTRIERLSDSGRALMKIAACLGQDFEEDTLSVAMMSLVRAKLMDIGSIGEIREACEQCIASGLLRQSGSQYSFVHDQVQATAFGLIPPKDLASMQLAIGQGLLNHGLPEKKKDKHQQNSSSLYGEDGEGDAFEANVLFLAVDLCNSVSSELDERSKTKLAAPNRRAATKAFQRSAFDAAIAYAKSGLSYLEEATGPTTEKTELLKLKLQTIVAEASLCVGDSTSTEEYAQKVIDSDFSFDEKYLGYVTKMLSEFSNNRMKDAIKTCLYILRELGFFKNVPHYPGIFRVLKEIFKTKRLMKKYTEEQLIDLPPMTDEKRIRAINIIYRITNVLYSSNPNLFLVLSLTAMRWTVKYGISQYSPPMFALYGMVASGVLEDFEHGTMIGDVALALSEKLQANQTIAMTTQVTFGFISHWKSDIRAARKPLEYGIQAGFQMGDVNNAIANLIILDQNSVFTGLHDLNDLEAIMRASVTKIRSYGQESMAAEHALTWQFVLNLIGKVDDPLVMTGDAMNQEKALEKAKATDHKVVTNCVACFGGQLAYLYENPGFAVSVMKVVKREDGIGYVMMPRHSSFLALAYVGTALEGKRPRHNLKQCRKILTMLKKWVAFGNINIRHFISLIEAEIAGLTAPDTAAPLYEEAIKLGGRIGGFRHDKAMAHARAARFFFIVRNDNHWGSYHLDKAIEAYCEWGAVGVAKHLAKIYMVAAPTPSSRRFTFSSEINMSKHMCEILTTRVKENLGIVRLAEGTEEGPERAQPGTAPNAIE